MANDILNISKIESGSIEIEKLFFNPMDEFESVIESYATNASNKDIDLSLWTDPKLSSKLLQSDAVKIKQILVNLISNAVKFTNKKGTIDVAIEVEESNEESMRVKFSVKDSGIGVSIEQKDKIFEAFSKKKR
jgi:signal transduction histidine kinase